MKHEAHSKHTHKIVDCKIIATWNDGRVEDLSVDLPDYLRELIELYLDEMDDLRTQNPEDYAMNGEIV